MADFLSKMIMPLTDFKKYAIYCLKRNRRVDPSLRASDNFEYYEKRKIINYKNSTREKGENTLTSYYEGGFFFPFMFFVFSFLFLKTNLIYLIEIAKINKKYSLIKIIKPYLVINFFLSLLGYASFVLLFFYFFYFQLEGILHSSETLSPEAVSNSLYSFFYNWFYLGLFVLFLLVFTIFKNYLKLEIVKIVLIEWSQSRKGCAFYNYINNKTTQEFLGGFVIL